MSEVTRSESAALVVLDLRVSLSDDSSVSQAGPRPGVPAPANDTAMVLRSSGDQTADTELEVQVQRGGYPLVRSAASGSIFVWRHSGDTYWRGWDTTAVISAWEAVQWTDGSGNLTWTKHPHVLTVASQRVLVAYEYRDTTSGSAKYGVRVQWRDRDSDWSTPVDVVTWTAAPGVDFWPCLVLLESGRVMLYHWVEDTSASTGQIRAWYSDDDGETWALAEDYVLSTALDTSTYEVRRIRGASQLGQVLLLAHVRDTSATYRESIIQYGSSDAGNTFSKVGETDASTAAHAAPEVVVAEGYYVIAWMTASATLSGWSYVARAASAFSDIISLIEAHTTIASDYLYGAYVGATGQILDTAHTLAVSDAGILTLHGYTPDVGHEGGYSWVSLDGGVTWGRHATAAGYATWWQSVDASTHPAYLSATYAEGRLVMAHQWAANPGNEDQSLAVAYLGGYSTVTMPGWARFPAIRDRASWTRTWLPYDEPQDTYWTAHGAGTDSLTSGYLLVTVGAGSTRYYSRTPSVATGQALIVEFAVSAVTGGSITNNDTSVMLRTDDGTTQYQVTIRIAHVATGIQYVVRDDIAGANISLTRDISGSGVFRVAMDVTGKIEVWHRSLDREADRDWTAGICTSGLTGGAGGSGDTIEWGHRGGAASASSHWWWFFDADGYTSGFGLHNGQTNPDSLFGRGLSPDGVYVDEGVIIDAQDGPAIRSDQWSIATRYEYPIERVLELQPRRRWRSTDTSSQTIILDISDHGMAWVGEALYIGLYGSTLSQLLVEVYDTSSSSWVSIGTAYASEGMEGLAWTREGDTVRPSSSTASTDEPYLRRSEVRGGYLAMGTVSREIAEQREGKWTDGTQLIPWLTLDGIDGTEAASGTGAKIVPPSWGIVVHLGGQRASRIRLTQAAGSATAPAPPDGYWSLGALVVGEVMPLSSCPSWGRVVETEVSTEVDEARDWTIATYEPAPARRIVEMSWVDGLDHTDTTGYDADPDWYDLSTVSSAEPAGNVHGVGYQLEGLIREVGGPGTPVVLLPRLEREGSDLQVLTRRDLHILGRLTERVRLEQVLGEPGESEVYRIPAISLREVV